MRTGLSRRFYNGFAYLPVLGLLGLVGLLAVSVQLVSNWATLPQLMVSQTLSCSGDSKVICEEVKGCKWTESKITSVCKIANGKCPDGCKYTPAQTSSGKCSQFGSQSVCLDVDGCEWKEKCSLVPKTYQCGTVQCKSGEGNCRWEKTGYCVCNGLKKPVYGSKAECANPISNENCVWKSSSVCVGTYTVEVNKCSLSCVGTYTKLVGEAKCEGSYAKVVGKCTGTPIADGCAKEGESCANLVCCAGVTCQQFAGEKLCLTDNPYPSPYCDQRMEEGCWQSGRSCVADGQGGHCSAVQATAIPSPKPSPGGVVSDQGCNAKLKIICESRGEVCSYNASGGYGCTPVIRSSPSPLPRENNQSCEKNEDCRSNNCQLFPGNVRYCTTAENKGGSYVAKEGEFCGVDSFGTYSCTEGYECREGKCVKSIAEGTTRCSGNNLSMETYRNGQWQSQLCPSYCENKKCVDLAYEAVKPSSLDPEDKLSLSQDPVMSDSLEATYQSMMEYCSQFPGYQEDCVRTYKNSFEQGVATGDTCVAYYMLEDPGLSVDQAKEYCNDEKANALTAAVLAYSGTQVFNAVAPVMVEHGVGTGLLYAANSVPSTLVTGLNIATFAYGTATCSVNPYSDICAGYLAGLVVDPTWLSQVDSSIKGVGGEVERRVSNLVTVEPITYLDESTRVIQGYGLNWDDLSRISPETPGLTDIQRMLISRESEKGISVWLADVDVIAAERMFAAHEQAGAGGLAHFPDASSITIPRSGFQPKYINYANPGVDLSQLSAEDMINPANWISIPDESSLMAAVMHEEGHMIGSQIVNPFTQTEIVKNEVLATDYAVNEAGNLTGLLRDSELIENVFKLSGGYSDEALLQELLKGGMYRDAVLRSMRMTELSGNPFKQFLFRLGLIE